MKARSRDCSISSSDLKMRLIKASTKAIATLGMAFQAEYGAPSGPVAESLARRRACSTTLWSGRRESRSWEKDPRTSSKREFISERSTSFFSNFSDQCLLHSAAILSVSVVKQRGEGEGEGVREGGVNTGLVAIKSPRTSGQSSGSGPRPPAPPGTQNFGPKFWVRPGSGPCPEGGRL